MLRKPATVGVFVVVIGASLLFALSRKTFSLGALATTVASDSHQNDRTEVEIVTLRSWGFEPKEISRPPGPFYLAIDNQSGLEVIDVSLDKETGHKLQSVDLSKGKAKWRQKLALGPGVYLLREAGHPEWTCQITVQP